MAAATARASQAGASRGNPCLTAVAQSETDGGVTPAEVRHGDDRLYRRDHNGGEWEWGSTLAVELVWDNSCNIDGRVLYQRNYNMRLEASRASDSRSEQDRKTYVTRFEGGEHIHRESPKE